MLRLAAIILTILTFPCLVAAQESEGMPDEATLDARLHRDQDPSLGPTDTGDTPQLLIEATTKDGKASLRWGTKAKKIPATQRRQWSIVFSGKLGDDQKTTLGDLDGLNDDISVTGNHSWYLWTPATGPGASAIRKKYCTMDARDRGATFSQGTICDMEYLTGPKAEEYKQAWRNEIYEATPVNRVLLSAKIGYSKFEYFRSSDLEKTSDRELGWSASAVYSRLSTTNYVWSGGLRVERSYEDADKVFVCTPGPVAGSELCDQQPLGAPKRTDKSVVFGEWRAFYGSLAVSPKLSYDLQNSTLGIQIPVWLFRDTKGNFTGGARLDWNDDADETTFTVFVSTPLSLFSK